MKYVKYLAQYLAHRNYYKSTHKLEKKSFVKLYVLISSLKNKGTH